MRTEHKSYPKALPVRLSRYKLRKLKRQVAERDGRQCACGSRFCLSVHHIVKLSQGGSDTAENMILECVVCHGADHGRKIIVY